MSEKILLVGAGPMAIAYARVLQEMGRGFEAVGRGQASAAAFQAETGVPAVPGGLDAWLKSGTGVPRRAIVAVSENELGRASLALLEHGVSSLLVEKPGGFLPSEIRRVEELARSRDARVFVGYNRRFHASTQAARRLIEGDGGVSSFHFEFTEWGHVVSKKVCPQSVKDEWFLHNSSHVVDLAFYLGGRPAKLASFAGGSLDWHPRAAKYSGAGVTAAGALFSYHANWGAPGRWSVEILTAVNRYILRPLEKLQVQKLGSVAIEEVAIDDELDRRFKPGLFRQVEAFLRSDDSILPTVSEQVANLRDYERIEAGAAANQPS